MSSQTEYYRLCRLIDEALRPYTIPELSAVSLTKQNEKQLLIALSQISRQIKLWTDEFDDCDSNSESMPKPHVEGKYSVSSASHSEDHHCLTKIVTELILLLAVESKYVQHIAGNILVVISEFVAASGSCFDEYMHLLGLCLEASICNCLPYSEPLTKSKDLNCDSSTSVVALALALKITNWSTGAGIIRVLRNILKHLKKECDADQLLKLYLNSIRTCLSNIPWDLLTEIHLGQSGKSLGRSSGDDSWFLFSGNLVQFFCSLVAQGDSSETAVGSLDEKLLTCEISNVFPKVLAWFLGKNGDCNKTCTSHYFRHKILILMIRLSFQIHLDRPVLVSWLNIINKYFQDLLSEPITKLAVDQEDCLEGSPFLVSSPVGKKGISSRHLQRLSVFLFLRCSLSFFSQRAGIEERCVCTNQTSCLDLDQNGGPTCCSRKQGLLELYKWLQRHLPLDIFLDYDIYFESCTRFALYFLQLFMHEDDILFKVLLQLFCIPFSQRQMYKVANTSQELKDDVLFLVSSLLNPVMLFHLFLAELHYDHQVLLDYLISKHTGASSAEYLLRCLRTVCDSWNFFVEFRLEDEVVNQAHCKKRKLEKGCKRQHVYGSKQCGTNRLPFEDAMECLLSLKKSVLNLHKKDLFPYNPDVLLRHLTRFEELCFKQKDTLTSEIGIIT